MEKKEDKSQKTLTEKPKDLKQEETPLPEKPKAVEQEKPQTVETKPQSIDSFKKESDNKQKSVNKEILEASETVKDTKVKFKRNLEKTNVEYDFKIIQDTSKNHTQAESLKTL